MLLTHNANKSPMATEMASSELLVYFEQGLEYWLRLKQKLNQQLTGKAMLTSEDGNEINDLPQYIQHQLLVFFKQQKALAAQQGLKLQHSWYDRIDYALSAIIDEQLLHQVEWKYDEVWLKLLLEKALFGSCNAGSRLIDQMQALTDIGHPANPQEQQLAGIYLRILRLGFGGKYRNQPDKQQGLSHKLLSLAAISLPALDGSRLLSQAYKHNKNQEHQARLAPISRWQKFIAALVALYVLLSWLVWSWLTSDLAAALANYHQA